MSAVTSFIPPNSLGDLPEGGEARWRNRKESVSEIAREVRKATGDIQNEAAELGAALQVTRQTHLYGWRVTLLDRGG